MVSLMMYWSLIYTLCQTLLHAFSVCMVHPNYATNTNTAHRNRIKILAKSFTDEAILAASYAKHEKRPPSTAAAAAETTTTTTTTTTVVIADSGALTVAPDL